MKLCAQMKKNESEYVVGWGGGWSEAGPNPKQSFKHRPQSAVNVVLFWRFKTLFLPATHSERLSQPNELSLLPNRF